MPDISMCRDHECPLKDSCYRFTAKPDPHWQSYFKGSPRGTAFGVDDCSHYWPKEPRDDL